MKKRLLKFRREKTAPAPARITNETVAEHRERILAGGRRFKYPVQYARHRLVFNTIIITIVALVIIALFGWWQLYIVQNTSTFFYRVTRVLPLPVASVEGQQVAYADYLMYYNGSAHYLQNSEAANLQSEASKRQLEDIKRKAIDTAIADTYAAKQARRLGIEVTLAEIDQVVSDDRNTVNGRISQETYDASALSVLGWSPDEYRQDIKAKLIRQKVAYALDDNAQKRQEQAAQLITAPNSDFEKIAVQLGGEGDAKVEVGMSGMVPYTNKDGGLSETAVKLEKGQVSQAVKTDTGDGYYFIKVLDKTDTQVNYLYLRIPLTVFTQTLTALKNDKKIHEYIAISTAEVQKPAQ